VLLTKQQQPTSMSLSGDLYSPVEMLKLLPVLFKTFFHHVAAPGLNILNILAWIADPGLF
jgi:hypothetical protein